MEFRAEVDSVKVRLGGADTFPEVRAIHRKSEIGGEKTPGAHYVTKE